MQQILLLSGNTADEMVMVQAKVGWWKIVLGFVVWQPSYLLLPLLKTTEDKIEYLEAIKTEATAALKENELRGRLEKDKIGAIKGVFESRLKIQRK